MLKPLTTGFAAGLRATPLILLAVVVVPTAANAQSGLQIEAARDPGRADIPQTARQVGLGSVVASSGAADGAASVPSALTLQTGTDFVFAVGSLLYSRQELLLTPSTSPNAGPRRGTDAQPSALGHVAAAMRRRNWAIAGFLDRSGYSHEFKTDRNLVGGGILFPSCFEVYASGGAQVEQSVTRSGGSIAIGTRRAGLGVSVYATHLDYLLQTTEMLENIDCSANRPRRPVSFETRSDQIQFDNWATGVSISGHVGIGKSSSVIARWRHEPRVTGKVNGGMPVDFNVPDTLSIAWMTRRDTFEFFGEVSWHEYGAADFVTYRFVPQKLLCGGLDLPDAAGNRLPCGMRNTFAVRSGLEYGVHVGTGRLLFRGGVAWEPGYTFSREAYPWGFGPVRGLSGPMRWDPPREDFIWLSGGAGYSRRHREVGLGVGYAQKQWRLIADLRLTR